MENILQEIRQLVDLVEAEKEARLLKKKAHDERQAREHVEYVGPIMDMIAEVAKEYPGSVKIHGSSLGGFDAYVKTMEAWHTSKLSWRLTEDGKGYFELMSCGITDRFHADGSSIHHSSYPKTLREALIEILTRAILS